MFGLRNFNALDFQDYVNRFSLQTDLLGIMNSPIVQDGKQWQTEISALAQKKVIEYEVSYNQERIRSVALQYIKSCIPTFYLPNTPPFTNTIDPFNTLT